MPAAVKKTVAVVCPKCGHEQQEPRGAYSTVCKECRSHFRLEEVAPAQALAAKPAIELRPIKCFQCGTEMNVPQAAESSMCKRCSSHIDLRDYQITQTLSKNFRTYGKLVLEEKGYLLNSDTLVRHAVIKGRFIGKLFAEESLEIHSSASIKGTFSSGCLIIPSGHHFRWMEPLKVRNAEIAGELIGNLQAEGVVRLKPTARHFGDIDAAGLIVESGAVFVGSASIKRKPAAKTPRQPEPKRSI
jgi:cytoskeletal protein CcmA (bactofilin family)